MRKLQLVVIQRVLHMKHGICFPFPAMMRIHMILFTTMEFGILKYCEICDIRVETTVTVSYTHLDASAAYRQLRNYMYEIPSMFIYNAVCVMSDLTTSKAGTITVSYTHLLQ